MSNPNINVNVSGPVQPESVYKTKVLRGNQPFADQIGEANTKYVIKHNFDLQDGTVNIPAGCILEFDGGSLKNGTLVCTGTLLYHTSDAFLTNVTLSGSFTDKSAFATVARSGSYNDLNDKPVIPTVPTNVSAFVNDAGYMVNANGSTFPENAAVGQMFFYTPDGGTAIPTWWNGTAWVKADGTAAVETEPEETEPESV